MRHRLSKLNPDNVSVTLIGVVIRITYRNDETGYTVLRLESESAPPEALTNEGLMTAVGVMPELAEGETLELTGRWVDDVRYGRQLKAERAIPIAPRSKRGIIGYLVEMVRGVGETTAERIYDTFGEDTLNILEHTPERIREVYAIKKQVAENVIEAFKNGQGRAERQIMIHLQSYGITAGMARKIYLQYGEMALGVVSNDPYQLADELEGVGFKRADAIARGMGKALDDPARLRAGLIYALSQLALEGHTYAPRELLLEKAVELLEVQGERPRLAATLQAQTVAGNIIRDTLHNRDEIIEAYYLPVFFNSEKGVTRLLNALLESPSKIIFEMANTDWKAYLRQLAHDLSSELTEQQQGAVKAALTSKLSVLTGGPGTGKTTTLKMVIWALEQEGYTYALASPTGRAAKRLAEATERDASTIHRLLVFNAQTWNFEFNEDNPLDIDMLIVDETSMLDLVLFYNLLKALRPSTHLMLVGDVDQLPSVGAGNVLKDVIYSQRAGVTRLDRIFRQDKKSLIALNAHRINHGEMPILDNQSEDFYYFNLSEAPEVAQMVVDVVVNRLPTKFGYEPMSQIQVLAPMYRGAAGVDALNQALQSALNHDPRKMEVRLGFRKFRVGDRVMQTKNNYEKNVFNGDIGTLQGINDKEKSLRVVIDDEFVDYEYSEAEEQLIHAYCISTHRSQGSEYPVVVMPIVKQHYMMLQRNLLYTAITRAKKMVVLVGDKGAVFMAVQNNKVAERYSGLVARLLKA